MAISHYDRSPIMFGVPVDLLLDCIYCDNINKFIQLLPRLDLTKKESPSRDNLLHYVSRRSNYELMTYVIDNLG